MEGEQREVEGRMERTERGNREVVWRSAERDGRNRDQWGRGGGRWADMWMGLDRAEVEREREKGVKE